MTDEECFDLLKQLVNYARHRGTDSHSYRTVRKEIIKAIKEDIGARHFFRVVFKGIGIVPKETTKVMSPGPRPNFFEHEGKDVCPACDGISNSCGRCGGSGYIDV